MDASSAAPNIDELLARAIEHHRSGELTRAEWAYQELLEHSPDHPDANHLLGVVAHQMGDTASAIKRVSRSLEIQPDQPGALNNLGNMYAAVERLEEAIASYRRAIELKPDYAEAHHNLGNVLTDSDRVMESLECFHRAAELKTDDAASWTAYGTASEKLGRFEQAIEAFRTALQVEPDSQQTLSRLGAVLRKLNRLDEAKAVYETWSAIAPNNPVPTHLYQACSQDQAAPERASAEYVKATFDSFAETFESCLKELDYRVPELLGRKAKDKLARIGWADKSAVDLGCGTGLCGPYLRDETATLIGVDLSPGMLAKAHTREIYDQLVEADLIDYLAGCDEQHDLILSADTLIYLGDLRKTFAAAHAALCPQGTLMFSLEKLAPEHPQGYRLGSSGRYQHTRRCIERWLIDSGFAIDEIIETSLRKEGYETIAGYLITATKSER